MKSKALVDDLTEYVNRGITPRYTENLEDSIPVINQRCIRDLHVNMELVRLNDLSKRKVTEGKTLQKNDVLINSTGVGTLGRVAQFYGESGSATVDSHVTIVRPNPRLVDPIYFGYLLKSKQDLIESFAAGTTGQTELARDSVKEMVLEYVSDIQKQKVIGSCFLALDKKIQLNQQTNQTLESISQALFKSWFVDFDPVKAKIAVLEAGGSEEEALLATMQVISSKSAEELAAFEVEMPEEYAELRATAELFPAAMVGSELGEVPEGWQAGTLADLAYLNKNSWTKRTLPTEIDYVDLANTKNGTIETTTRYSADDAPSRARRKLFDGDTIVGTVRPGNRSFSFIKQPSDSLTGSTGFAVLSPKRKAFAEFVYIAATSDDSISRLAHLADGGAYPAVRSDAVSGLSVIISTDPILDSFHLLVSKNFEQSGKLRSQNMVLSHVRDTLLPKLLSGELTVFSNEIEEGVANVG